MVVVGGCVVELMVMRLCKEDGEDHGVVVLHGGEEERKKDEDGEEDDGDGDGFGYLMKVRCGILDVAVKMK